MSRKSLLGLAAVAAIGGSLAMTSSANAFHGGSHGSNGGSFGGLFHRHHGSSGASHGEASNSCGCNGSDDAHEGNHEDNDHSATADHDERGMEAPSREGRRDSNGVVVTGRDHDGRHHESGANHDSKKDNDDDKNVDHKRDDDKKKEKEMKKDENKDRDRDKENAKKDESKK